MSKLPECVTATRIGHWSMGVESEYDEMGEQAPVTWSCVCGARLTLDRYDYDADRYVITPQAHKDEFLATHNACVAKCFRCGKAPVQTRDAWCDACTDKADTPVTEDWIPF